MVLALAIGDIGVPLGSQGIPQKLKELLQPGKIHQVICTGNLCDEVRHMLNVSLSLSLAERIGLLLVLVFPFNPTTSDTHRVCDIRDTGNDGLPKDSFQ